MLIIGIIVDPQQGAATRLIEDLGTLLSLEPALAPMEVVLLENPGETPASPTDPGSIQKLARRSGISLHWKSLDEQRSDAARGLFGNLTLSSGRQPIAIARTMLQRYVSQHHASQGFQRDPASVAWILDEDLRLTPMLERLEKGDYSLVQTIYALRQQGVDVAIAPIQGAPPLPSQSSIRVNLKDVLRHLERLEQLRPHDLWPDLSGENALARAHLQDYYYDFSHAHADAGETPFWLEPLHPHETAFDILARLASGLETLAAGQPLTRALRPGPAPLNLPPTVARGGNTLLLNPGLLAEIPNLAPCIEGRVTRRSDMVWARLARLLKHARIVQADIPVEQDRTGCGSSPFEASKLLDDVRGSALIAALDQALELNAWGEAPSPDAQPALEALSAAQSRYASHRAHRLSIIQSSEDEVRNILLALRLKLEGWEQQSPWDVPPFRFRTVIAQLQAGLNTLTQAYEQQEPILWQHLAPLQCSSEELSAVSEFLRGLMSAVHAYHRAIES